MTDHDPTRQDSIGQELTRQGLVDTAAASVSPRLTRRAVLSLGLALVGGGLLPTLNALAQVSNLDTDPMLAAVADPAAAVGLGRAYLAAYPAEADAEQLRGLLRRTLFADLPMSAEDGDAFWQSKRTTRTAGTTTPKSAEDGYAFCQGLVRALREDYIGGEVIDLDGWQISRGEARLYALAALNSR